MKLSNKEISIEVAAHGAELVRLEERRNALEAMGNSLNRGFPLNTNDVQSALTRLNTCIRDEVSALRTVGDNIATLAQRSSVDWDSLEQGLRGLRQPVNSVLTAVRRLPDAASGLASALRNLEDPSGQLIGPMSQMADAVDGRYRRNGQ